MPDVAKLREEAEAKGLHGDAEKRYVGGVFNRIRQAHARATTPGKGAAHLNRKKRVEKRKPAPAAKAPQAKAPAKAKKPTLVFGVSKVPPEPKPKREPGAYTPKQQALVDEAERHYADYQRGKPHAYSAYRDAELKLQRLDKKAYERYQEQHYAAAREHEQAQTADRKKLEAFNDNSLLVRARTDAKAREQLEATRKQLAERDKENTEQIDKLEADMNERAKLQREAQRRGDTETAERLRKEINNIDEVAIGPLRRARHEIRVRRDNLLDSGYLKRR